MKPKIQTYTVPGKWDIQWIGPMKFTEFIKKHTNGRVDCSIHPVGEFVGPRETWTSVSAGTIDAGTTLALYQGGTHPEYAFDFGTVRSNEEYFKVMHAGALDILKDEMLEENIRIFGHFAITRYAAISMKKGFVKTLEDLQGKKIRGMGGASNEFLKHAGAGVVTLPMSEVPSALQTGVVDGIHTGLAGLHAMHLWEVAPYFTSTQHGSFGFFFLMNEDIYRQFPPDVKAGIAAAQSDLEKWNYEYDKAMRKEIVQDTKQRGTKWYFLTGKEDLRWQKILSDKTVAWVMKRKPVIGKRLFEVLEKALGRKVLQ